MLKGFNIQQMMKQAQEMQKKMEIAQEELKSTQLSGEAGAGAVSVILNGKKDLVSIKIKPEAINPDNPQSVDTETIEMLEDLITEAVKDASGKVTQLAESKMHSVTGGMNMPGLF